MKKERYAALLILLAFFSGMFLTAATSGCDAANDMTAKYSNELHPGSPFSISEESGIESAARTH